MWHRRARAVSLLVAAAAAWAICGDAWSLGEERWGNDPLHGANYTDWPNVMPVINHRSRVYSWWVNGNEMFYYRGDTDALNAALRDFAKVETDERIVVIRPGPDHAWTFMQDKEVPYDWNLHLMGGIARAMVGRHDGPTPWDAWPTLTIRLGGNVELEKITLPQGVKLMQAGDMAAILRQRLKSDEKQIRGYAAGELPTVAPYNEDDARAVAALLDAEDDWLIQMAAGALSWYGPVAKFALPRLRELKDAAKKPHVKERLTQTIDAIENGKHDAEAEKAHHDQVKRIAKFVQPRKDAVPDPVGKAQEK